MTSQRTAIVILNWNGWRDTLACIESVLALENDANEIFVCDNASTDESVARILNWSQERLPLLNAARTAGGRVTLRFVDRTVVAPDRPRTASAPEQSVRSVTLLQSGWNGGYAAGNNVALRVALDEGFDYFWILNNDTEVDPGALTWLLLRTTADPTIGICGSTLVYAEQRDRVQARGGSRFLAIKGYGVSLDEGSHPGIEVDQSAVESQMSYVNGASMFVTRAFLTRVGLMDERYFLYWEEIDWATRGKASFKLGYAPKSIVFHKVGASIGTKEFGASSLLSEYYIARNRVRFCMRYSRISLPFIVFDLLRWTARFAMKGQWARLGNLLLAVAQVPRHSIGKAPR